MPKPTSNNAKSLVTICLGTVFNSYFRHDDTREGEFDIARHPSPFDSLRKSMVLFAISVIILIMFYFISTSLISFSSNYGLFQQETM